jgi:hypothetical protein
LRYVAICIQSIYHFAFINVADHGGEFLSFKDKFVDLVIQASLAASLELSALLRPVAYVEVVIEKNS